ncbi:hypothetical protein B4O97_03545 [Marispirochaeta aestuarii]|uniref:Uncharacterized protein n=1 Tax=Marispirochaeta aestuarii TaxID=1963862 RepID=A0A1Y1S1G6_9SPIO|nr:hypothetical protein [Marispirochaeta aestuarii]ORC37277.1 hypothetical protein B4O97_03545 [Marispirochaeta aestuarii]
MTTEQFINEAQGYFGNYTPTQKKYVSMWLNKKSEKCLPLIFAEVVMVHSPSLRMPPGVAELEKAFKAIPEQKWRELESPVLQIEEREFTEEEIEENMQKIKAIFEGLGKKKNIRRNK